MIPLFSRHRWHEILARIFRILFISAIVGNALTQNWLNLFTSMLALLATYLPFVWARKNRIHIPPGFQMVILFFIFATMYLGELREYYLKFWWWDLMLHTLSGVILGFIGFILVYMLNQEEEVEVVLSPLFIAIFSFTFAVTVGALWEIFEFSMDSFFGLNMQKPMRGIFRLKHKTSPLIDTMWDLIVDSIGALFASAVGYMYMKKDTSYFRKIATRFWENNN